jgi:NCAIR mutase (PurE)-related protein
MIRESALLRYRREIPAVVTEVFTRKYCDPHAVREEKVEATEIVQFAWEGTVREVDACDECKKEYETRFGFIFILCATGKSPEEILQALRKRLYNQKPTELKVAAEEQSKITQLRLAKLLELSA